jgi:DNA repair exonuclease SbcCD ATPase subunit
MENFISHTKSEVDFTKFDVALLVGVHDNNPNISNGAGKTSIFDAIRFALYNKTRFNSKEKVVKRGKFKSKVEFVFSVHGTYYKVIRIFNKKSGVGDVEFFKKSDNSWMPETCDTPTATTQKIMDVVGMSHDTFANSVYFRQNDISGFAGAKPTERKGILKEVLQIGVWDEYQDVAKEKEKELLKRKQIVEQRLGELGEVEIEKNNCENQLQTNCNKLKDIETQIKDLENNINNINENIFKVEQTTYSGTSKRDLEQKLLAINSRLKELKELKEKLKLEAKKNNDVISKTNDDISNIEDDLVSYAKEILLVDCKYKEKAYDICKEDIDCLYGERSLSLNKEKRDTLQNSISLYDVQLSQLTSFEPGQECPVCLTEINDTAKVTKLRNDKKDNLQKLISSAKKEIANVKNLILKEEMAIRKANDCVLEIDRSELLISKISLNKSTAEKRNDEIKEICISLGKEWNELKSEKERVSILLDSSNDDCKLELENLNNDKISHEKSLKEYRNDMLNISSNNGALKNKIEIIERQISEKDALLLQKNQVSFDIDVYTKLAKAFGKDGIQAIIMENVTEDLKNFTNTVLEKICNYNVSVDFVTQTKKTDGNWKEDFEIVINMNGDILEFDDLSGGEQVRIAIAIRLAISQLLMQRVGSDIRFLLLDEVDQALDAQGLESLADAIIALSKDFKILVITHNEALKEKFNHIITVVKQPEGSVIRQ